MTGKQFNIVLISILDNINGKHPHTAIKLALNQIMYTRLQDKYDFSAYELVKL